MFDKYHCHRNGSLNLIYIMDILSLDVFQKGKQNVPIRLMPFISPTTQWNDCKCLEKPISTGKEWFGISNEGMENQEVLGN